VQSSATATAQSIPTSWVHVRGSQVNDIFVGSQLTEENKELSDELAVIDKNKTAYKLSELHRQIKHKSVSVRASDSSDVELRKILSRDSGN